MLSAHKTQLCMFQRLCTYFQDTGVLIFGGYVLSGHCNQQQISVKTEGVLISEGYLFTGFYGIFLMVMIALRRETLSNGQTSTQPVRCYAPAPALRVEPSVESST